MRSRLDAPPMIDNGRTLLPLRFVAQAMGGNVSWDPSEQKVTRFSAMISITRPSPRTGFSGGNWRRPSGSPIPMPWKK
ncbi:MAG: copper amine oxidase N-terminal domain-containing protein [Bacillota bacterium]|nr:copper amine oxidase N-terminal domain-containing protein [Bacillota bacterium]